MEDYSDGAVEQDGKVMRQEDTFGVEVEFDRVFDSVQGVESHRDAEDAADCGEEKDGSGRHRVR